MPRKLPPSAFDFKAARQARKFSQQGAAKLLHATQPSISRWEADGTMPEIYKMAWLLYWQLEDMKDDAANRSAKTRKTGSANRSRSVVNGAKRIRKSRKGMEESTNEILQQPASGTEQC